MNKQHTLSSIFKMVRLGFRQSGLRLILILGLGILAGLFGGVGISAVIPLFSILLKDSQIETNTLTNFIQTLFGFLHIPYTLSALVVFVAFLFLAKAVVSFLARYLNLTTAAEYEEKLRKSLFKKTLFADWPYLLEQKSGYLERIIMNDVFNSSTVIIRLANLCLLLSSLLMYALVAVSISAPITLLTMGFGGLIFLALRPMFSRTKKVVQAMADTEKETTHHIAESIYGIKSIKARGLESEVLDNVSSFFGRLRAARGSAAFYQYAVSSVMEPLGFFFIAGLFVAYHNRPDFHVISFATVVYLVQKMFAYVQSSQDNFHELISLAPYVTSVVQTRSLSRDHREVDEGTRPFKFKESLDIKNISFGYKPEQNVIEGVKMQIRRGEMIGLVGPSGGGKTTVVDILLRLLAPTQGEIALDGVAIQDIHLHSWRSHISYVPQDPFLLNGTIEDNVRFFDDAITAPQIKTALQMANAEEFINELPLGVGTVIGERGAKLSGGQRQRIVLARALARQPEILILDEATSSLDTHSEALIHTAIDNLKGKVTIIAIAHRLSTILSADVIYVLEKGTIQEMGNPQALLDDKNSYFYGLYHAHP